MTRINTRSLSFAIAVALGTFHTGVFAAGVPTTDIIGNAQMAADALRDAQQAAAALQEAQRAVEQAKSQFNELKNLTTGNSGYGSLLNDSRLTSYLPTTTTSGSWSTIYDKMNMGRLDSLRNEYGLISEDPLQQEVYDKKLTNLATAEDQYQANNVRLQNIKDLQAQADAAVTPQQKEDVSNRIKTEQAAIANESNRQATAKDLMEKQDDLLAQKQNDAFDKFLQTGE
jgi:type IV secretion system protein VirB5